jgi:ribonuclease PH
VANPFGQLVAAVSVGVIEGEPRLDLAYTEDRDAGVDANVVMVDPDQYVEVQGTGEHGTFARAELDRLLGLAEAGIRQLFEAQRRTLGW